MIVIKDEQCNANMGILYVAKQSKQTIRNKGFFHILYGHLTNSHNLCLAHTISEIGIKLLNVITPRHVVLRRSWITHHHRLLPHLHNPENGVSGLRSQRLSRKRFFSRHHRLTPNTSRRRRENRIGGIDKIPNSPERSPAG